MGKIKPIESKMKFAKVLLEKYEEQITRKYLIKCSDGEFFVDEDCFKFSDFLYEQIEGRLLSSVQYYYFQLKVIFKLHNSHNFFTHTGTMTVKLVKNSRERRTMFLTLQILECKH